MSLSEKNISPNLNKNLSRKCVMNTNLAISFLQANKNYGKGKTSVRVLVNLNMKIRQGEIYCLLGPSGCGKTTLLQCLVGKQRLNSGSVKVFGKSPGSPESRVPGPRVGYMPQEIALYQEFTFHETMNYFGRIFNLSCQKIQERKTFLLKILDLLNSKDILIRNLSGGQKRRISLACALLHEPEILILDEPTVGIDPLLRKNIWSHLLKISNSIKLKTTIVITTHYIEEARQANSIGIMRFGDLLYEGHPDTFLSTFDKTSLEDFYFHLCIKDKNKGNKLISDYEKNRLKHNFIIDERKRSESYNNEFNKIGGKKISYFSIHRLKALLVKNFLCMWRNFGFVLFQLLIPLVQASIFCFAIGRDPTGMTLAVINEEVTNGCSNYSRSCLFRRSDNFFQSINFDSHHSQLLSCRFLSYIDQEAIKIKSFTHIEEATNEVNLGKHLGINHIKKNFSFSFILRTYLPAKIGIPNEAIIDDSIIHVTLDMTNQLLGLTIQLRLLEYYKSFIKTNLDLCYISGELLSLPISFKKPIYGSSKPTFTEFMAPGVILCITFFISVGLTALSFIKEKKSVLDRNWIAGVNATELVLSHGISQFVVMIVQVSLIHICMIFFFQITTKGPIIWIIVLSIIQGLCGIAFGLVISSLCNTEQDAIQIALGSFYPNILLSGIIWPLEGMPFVLKEISYLLPQTYACESIRSIFSKGWGIVWMQVYRGYLFSLGWTGFFLFYVGLF